MPFPVFKKQEDIPEGFRDEYEEKDGEWHPKLPGDDDKEKLTGALEKERKARADAEKERKELEKRLKSLEDEAKGKDAGLSSEEVKTFRETTYKEIRAEIQEELDAAKAKVTEADGRVRALLLDNNVKALALKNGVSPEKIDDWWRLNGDSFDLDGDNKPTIKDGKGKDPVKFITEDLKKARPWLYEGTKAGGGGGGGGSPSLGAAGTSAEDVIKNPSGALQAARAREA
jgi:hypothetical protein